MTKNNRISVIGQIIEHTHYHVTHSDQREHLDPKGVRADKIFVFVCHEYGEDD